MLDTYIKNRGTTKTIIHDNLNTTNYNTMNEIQWDADYDGKIANLSLDVNSNGKHGHYDIQLNNEDLANILNIPSIDLPLDKRLARDFKSHDNYYNKEPVFIELDNPHTISNHTQEYSLDKPIKDSYKTHISSPLPQEELVIPLTIDKSLTIDKPLTIDKNILKSHNLTSKRHRKHKTHKVYKHRIPSKSIKHRKRRRSSSKTSKKYLSALF